MNQCEICEKNEITEDHHIKSRAYGGTNSPKNKAKICSNCHKLVHYGLIIIEGRFDGTNGDLLVWRKLGEDSITGFQDPPVYIVPNTEHIRENYLKSIKA